MQRPKFRRLVLLLFTLIMAGALVMIGRLTVDAGQERAAAYDSGHYDGYFAGQQDGVIQGRQEGRVLQKVSDVTPSSRKAVRDAFTEGYAAGANDAFAGYDGGWILSEPYVVTLERGTTPISYRIRSRTPMQAGSDYFRCPSGGVCQEAR